MSLIKKRDHVIDTIRATGKKDNRIVMKKVKIPTQLKTDYVTCPRCSKKGYVRSKGYCKLCKFRFNPHKKITWQNGKQMHVE